MTPYLELSLRSRGLRVTAGISEAPVLQNLRGEPKQGRMPVNWWLQERGNYLSLQVEPLPESPLDPLLDVAVCLPGDDGPPLCRLAWGVRRGDPLDPLRLALPFTPPRVPPVKLWQEAKALTPLGPQERKRAQAAGAELLQALADKDLGRVLQLLDYRFEEMARGFEIDEDDHRAQARRELGALLSTPGYGVVPVRQDAIRTIPCCGGRAYHLTKADGSPLVETLPTQTAAPTTMGVFVALVKGDWRVVR